MMIFNNQLKIVCSLSIIIFNLACNITESNHEASAIIKTNRTYPTMTHAVPDSEFTIVKYLFNKNKISLSNLKVYRVVNHKGYHVHCYQYYNSLEIFSDGVVFNFDTNDNYYYLGGELISKIEICFQPKVLMEEASNLFYNELKSDYWQRDSLETYFKRGFNAELGIIDLNAGQSYAEKKYVLAWRLTISGNSEYPKAYVRADILQLFSYSNGIIIDW